MDLEQIRADVECFMQEMSKEYYMQGSGLAEEVNFKSIYSKYPGLFTVANLKEIQDNLAKTSPDSEEERRLKLFREAFSGEIVSEENKGLTTKLFSIENNSKIEIEPGNYLTYRSSLMYLVKQSNRNRRAEIMKSISEFELLELNPVLEEIFLNEQFQIKKLGYANKIEMFNMLSGIDLYSINKLMQKFLSDTDELYADYLEKFAKEKLNLTIAQLERHDITSITKSADYDSFFTIEKMNEIISGFISKMGIDISAGDNIIFDLEARDNKSPRAFCSPVKIPAEVYLVLYPRGGEEDYTTFLHELGHALHFANVSDALPFEYKWYGDNSVTEAYAMTFDHLTMNESWMNRNLGVNVKNNKEYFIQKAFNELLILRRYAAKINYEIKLNETAGLNGKKELYEQIFTNACKHKNSQVRYLIDVDQYFYCARYIRAWMLQANIHEYLSKNYGELWFENKNAGSELMKIWNSGQKFNADELSAMNGSGPLSTAPLLKNIKSVLEN